jgi:hypothetical protein
MQGLVVREGRHEVKERKKERWEATVSDVVVGSWVPASLLVVSGAPATGRRTAYWAAPDRKGLSNAQWGGQTSGVPQIPLGHDLGDATEYALTGC